MLVAMAELSIHCYLLLVSLWRLLGIDIRRLALVHNDWQALAESSLYTQSLASFTVCCSSYYAEIIRQHWIRVGMI